MGYYITRVIPIAILFLTFLFLFQRRKITSKKRLLPIFLGVLLVVVLWITPFENLFITFKSPESIFNYAGDGEIITVVDSPNSVAILTKKGQSNYSTFFCTKNEKGFQLTTFNQAKKISTAKYESITVSIYSIMGTDDYYLRIWGIVSDDIVITDVLNTDLQPIYEDWQGQKIINLVAPINYNNEYCCFINGERISF